MGTMPFLLDNVHIFRSKESISEIPPSPVPLSSTNTPTVKTPVRRGKAVPPVTPVEDEQSDTQGTQNPNTNPSHNLRSPLHSHKRPMSPSCEVTESLDPPEKMSKEKQKFFKHSVFNAEKKSKRLREKSPQKSKQQEKEGKQELGRRRTRNDASINEDVKSQKKDLTKKSKVSLPDKKPLRNGRLKATETPPKKSQRIQAATAMAAGKSTLRRSGRAEARKKEQEKVTTEEESHEESSSEDECSSSSCDSDSAESDSSVEKSHSDSKIRMKKVIIPASNLDEKEKTFGSISGIHVDIDAPWGFAAAAQAVQDQKDNKTQCESKENKNLFTNLPEKISLFDKPPESSSQVDVKPLEDKKSHGMGQLKGLFDGLSHFFTAPTPSRATRSQPNYNPNKRKPKDDPTKKEESVKTEKEDSKNPSVPNPQSTLPASPAMSPSDLVKSAVNSQEHEAKQSKFVKAEDVKSASSSSSLGDKTAQTPAKKRSQQATKTLAVTVPPPSNQTGKIASCRGPTASCGQNTCRSIC